MGEVLIAIILTAIVGMLVFIWGIRKEQTLPETLTQQLMAKSRAVLIGRLRKQGEATFEEMGTWLDGLVVGPLWSSRRLKVSDPEKFLEALIPVLVEQGDIEEIRREGRRFYRLKNRK